VRFFRVLSISLLIGALARPGLAQADHEDPEVLIRDGNALRSRGQTARALGLFRRAYDIAPTPRAAAQLGLCEFALKSYLEAMSHLSEALATHDRWIEENRQQLETIASQLRTHLAQIQLSGTPDGAAIAIDGKLVGTLPAATAWALPGHVSIVVRAPGYSGETLAFDVAGGERRELHLDLKPDPSSTAAPNASEPARQPPSNASPAAFRIVEPKDTSTALTISSQGADRPPATSEHPRPIFRRWWFWTLVGGVVLTGTAVLIVAHPWRSSSTCDPPQCAVW
jgi:hypothetical protein